MYARPIRIAAILPVHAPHRGGAGARPPTRASDPVIDRLACYLEATPPGVAGVDPVLALAIARDLPDPATATAADAFRRIARLGSATEAFEVEIDGTPGAAAALRADRPAIIRLDVPEALRGGQAFLFERDARDRVTLLSAMPLMAGDPRVGARLEVPRQVPRMRPGQRPGRLWLTTPGTSQLLAVIVRHPDIRLDQHPLFQATDGALPSDDATRKDQPMIPAEARSMRVLLRQLLELPEESWAIAHGNIAIVGVAETAVAPVDYIRTTSHTVPTALPVPPTRNAAKRLASTSPQEDNEMLDHTNTKRGSKIMPLPETFPNDIEIDPGLLELIRTRHRDATRRLAETGERYVDLREEGGDCDPILKSPRAFKNLLDTARDKGLFLGSAAGKATGVPQVFPMQARIAVRAHDLRYDKDAKRWVDQGNANDVRATRAASFFDRLLDELDAVKSTPKIDIALLAQSFGLPLEIWEAHLSVFQAYADWERKRRAGDVFGEPLLAFGDFDYLTVPAKPERGLEIFDDLDDAADAGVLAAREERGDDGPLPPHIAHRSKQHRMAGSLESYDDPIRLNTRLWHRMDLPSGFESAECLLFERDSTGGVTLLNGHPLNGGRILHETVFESPLKPRCGMTLSVPGDSDLVLVMARPRSGDESLAEAMCFRRTAEIAGASAMDDLSAEELADLRRRLFARKRDDWMVVKRRIRLR